MKNEGLVTQLEKELQLYVNILAEAVQVVMDQDVSNYPILVLSKEPLEIGVPISKSSKSMDWIINISTLEEFVAKQVILSDKVENFKQVYKDPRDFFCLFVHDAGSAQFIFMPYSSEWKN